MKDPYQVLLLPQDASPELVKLMYRKLALKYHPDRNSENREEAQRSMKEINEAYEAIKKSDPDNPKWDFMDYKFEDPLINLGFGSVANLDCGAQIRKVQRERETESAAEDMGLFISSAFRSNFYLEEFDSQIELEDILIAVSRKKGIKIHPAYVRPTLCHYKIDSIVEPRIEEFCDMVSRGDPPSEIINHFGLRNVLSSEKLQSLKVYLGRMIEPWLDTLETEDGGLKISYEDLYLELSKTDYIFIQYLVFGDNLLGS
jgi:hypothetical protein